MSLSLLKCDIKTKTKATIITTFITTYGLKKNMYSNYIGKEIRMDDLFSI